MRHKFILPIVKQTARLNFKEAMILIRKNGVCFATKHVFSIG